MIYDLAIIGGGPAGVAAGVYAARKRLKTVFITKDWESQSTVSTGIENWIGTPKISGAELGKNLEAHLRAYAGEYVKIQTGEICKKITKDEASKAGKAGTLFKIESSKGMYEARTILIASGSSRRKLDVPGADKFEHKGVTYCASCDGPLFADMDVAVIGGGNAALESVAQLSAYCKSVTLLNRSEKFRADEVTVEAVSKIKNVKIIKNAVPTEVKGDKFVSGISYTDAKNGKDIELPVSGIFVEIGSIPATEYAKDVVERTADGYIVTDPRDQKTKTPGIWSAGDCTDGLYHQNNIAAGDGVKALEDIYLSLHAR
ncbi:MAG: FAD-dependent oxidoreductase [bacterium]